MSTITYEVIYDLPPEHWYTLRRARRAEIWEEDGLKYITVVDSHKKPRRAAKEAKEVRVWRMS